MKLSDTASPLFLTVAQVAQRYGVSTDSIWRWKRNGDFPKPVRVGNNSTRWRLSDIEEYDRQLTACFVCNLDLVAA